MHDSNIVHKEKFQYIYIIATIIHEKNINKILIYNAMNAKLKSPCRNPFQSVHELIHRRYFCLSFFLLGNLNYIQH